jgi:hypothetical protein
MLKPSYAASSVVVSMLPFVSTRATVRRVPPSVVVDAIFATPGAAA